MLVRVEPNRGGDEAALTRARDLAFAEALVSIGQALTLLGSRLSTVHGAPAGAGRAVKPSVNGTGQPAAAGAAVPRGGLGERQRTVLALGGLDAETGMSAGDVVVATGFKRPNVHPLMARLVELGHLEQVPDEQPVRWRRTKVQLLEQPN